MTTDRDALELECQLRFIDLASQQDPQAVPLDLFIDGFWEGVRASARPRSIAQLTGLIEMRRARASGRIK